MVLEKTTEQKRSRSLIAVALVTASLAIVVAAAALYRSYHVQTGSEQGAQPSESRLKRIRAENVLRVGYGGFPPYTIINPNERDQNKRVSGLIVDLVSEIARRNNPPLRVEWYNLNWETLQADMNSNKFDFLADAVYETVPRAIDYSFTQPYSYFGIAVGLVRKDDNRFQSFGDIDKSGIVVALPLGWTSAEYAHKHLSKCTFRETPAGKEGFVQLDDVANNRADIALQDVPTVVQYVRQHPTTVKALWLSQPPSTVPASFLVRQGDPDLLNFLNTALNIVRADGTLDELDRKWNGLGSYERPPLVVGAGLAR